MALIKEIWIADVQEALNQNADFLPYSTDHSGYVAFGTVHLPQSGANPTVIVAPSTFPLTVSERTDTDRTYSLVQYALQPTLITNIDELQISYDKRQSVIGQQLSTLTQTIGNYVATSWAAIGATNLIATTGAAGTSLAPGATGTRKQVALLDIANLAAKLDKDTVPRKGRKLLMPVEMFWELFTISDIVRASYNGFQVNALATGVVAQLFGFDIMIRPTVAVYANGGTSPKAVGAATATTDNLACIAWHPTVVSRALGSMTPLYDAGSNGNGKPEYLGSIFNMEVMLGSAILRTDMKGVASLVQTWVS
ncbi:MAG: hypothetical protein KA450_14645 [Bacteroidia bacterium]|nr:hypothetical protein [Bacteroidota bacterium]MBP6414680.1 hypothetical protein [Bacteroidia bacterium]